MFKIVEKIIGNIGRITIDSNNIDSSSPKSDLVECISSWAKHPELEPVDGGWIYKEEFFPDYLTVGGASFFIFTLALKFCKGQGIDHGCGYWSLPGSLPIDIRGTGKTNKLEDISPSSLDYIFSSHFLEHIDDWLEILIEWNSLLKNGGKLFLYLPHQDCKLFHRGAPMIGEGHRWIPTQQSVVHAVNKLGFKVFEYSNELDAMQSFYVIAEKITDLEENDLLRAKLNILNDIYTKNSNLLSLANIEETFSGTFVGFMGILNEFAYKYELRQFTNWSKVWEYPWLWFNLLARIDLSDIKIVDLGSEISPMPWFLAFLGAKVTIIESDEQWIPTWEKLKEQTGFDVSWHIVDDEILPIPDGFADIVTSFSVVEHQPQKDLAISEIVRVLISGGRLAISFDICEPDMGMTFPEWNGHALTMKEVEDVILSHTGFEVKSKSPQWNVEDIPEFIKWHLQSASHHNYTVGAAILRKC